MTLRKWSKRHAYWVCEIRSVHPKLYNLPTIRIVSVYATWDQNNFNDFDKLRNQKHMISFHMYIPTLGIYPKMYAGIYVQDIWSIEEARGSFEYRNFMFFDAQIIVFAWRSEKYCNCSAEKWTRVIRFPGQRPRFKKKQEMINALALGDLTQRVVAVSHFHGCKQHSSFHGMLCVTNEMTSPHRWCEAVILLMIQNTL